MLQASMRCTTCCVKLTVLSNPEMARQWPWTTLKGLGAAYIHLIQGSLLVPLILVHPQGMLVELAWLLLPKKLLMSRAAGVLLRAFLLAILLVSLLTCTHSQDGNVDVQVCTL